MKTKVIKCKNPACDLSIIISAEVKHSPESIHNFQAVYNFVGAKEVHGTGMIICHCGKANSANRFATAFQRNAMKELEKELHRLQRELNSPRLRTYIHGDESEQEQNRKAERASKLDRFNEVLLILNGQTSEAIHPQPQPCKHPPTRLHSWHAGGVLCVACNECGEVLTGGAA